MTSAQDVISYIQELQDDDTFPRNIKQKLSQFSETLKGNGELSIKIDKIFVELEEICNDINIQPFVRTQLWNISSMLESLNQKPARK